MAIRLLVITVLVLFVLAGTAICGSPPDAAPDSAWTSRECGFQIELPPRWAATTYGCVTGFEPPGWDAMADTCWHDVPGEAVTVELARGTLADVCDEMAICQDEDGVWWILGRWRVRSRGWTIESPYWTGVRGESETGKYRKTGGYDGPAKAFVALLDDGGGRLALIVADNMMDDREVFDRMVASFRFLSAGN